MINIHIYQYIIEKKPTDNFNKNQEAFKKIFGPYQVTNKTRDFTKCFHPEGKLGFQGIWSMGGWEKLSKQNAQAFKKHNFTQEQENKGGMIVFPQEIKNLLNCEDKEKAEEALNSLHKEQKEFAKQLYSSSLLYNFTQKHKGTEYFFGRGFLGKFPSYTNYFFDKNSLTLEISRVTSEDLIKLAEDIADIFFQEILVVKDYNNDKIYLVNGRAKDNNLDLFMNIYHSMQKAGLINGADYAPYLKKYEKIRFPTQFNHYIRLAKKEYIRNYLVKKSL